MNQEAQIEQARKRVEAEAREAITSIQQQLDARGCERCVDCEAVIPKRRRAASPSAIRCIDCQSRFEIEGGR
ncbi:MULTISPECIES: TraR/DksA C4-type zinc finger protein [Polycladidibacter]|uniref:TraR/DksA C4-type zinc finger protein n=1 Tax=Polycladidibacter TaxID=2821833 RepID=UPI00083603CC|nr:MULTISPECIES: TraR/DksA C4-type zinc finger protein [Pseudovibrio]